MPSSNIALMPTVFHAIGDAIAIIERVGEDRFRFVYGNRASNELGFYRAEHEGKWITDIFPAPLAQQLEASYLDVVNRGEPVTYSQEVPLEKGKWLGDITYYPVREDGAVTKLIVVAKNITEQKKSQLELEKQYLFLDSVMNGVSDAILVTNERHVIVRVNEAFETMFGWAKEELVGTAVTDMDFIPPSAQLEAGSIARRMARGEGVVNLISPRKRKDGSVVEVSMSISIITDRSGQIIGYAAIFRDIAEQRKNERLLAESEQRYKSLFDYNPDAVIALDKLGRFVSVNARAVEITGVPADVMEGMTFAPFVHPDDLAKAERNFSVSVSGAVGDIDVRIMSKTSADGYLHMRFTTMPMFVNGEVIGVYAVGKDITEMVKAQRELKTSEQRYKALFERNPDAVFSFDVQGNITSFNRNTQEFSGYAAEDLYGKSIVPFCHPDDVEHTLANVGRVLNGRETVNYEVRIWHNTRQEYFIMNVTNLPIEIDGEVVGVYAIAKDVSRLRAAERELQESEQRFKSLFEHNPDFVYSCDREGRVTSINQATLSGASAHQVVGQPYQVFVDPSYAPKSTENFEATLSGEVRRYEIVAVDGKEYDITNIPIYIDGRVTGVFGIAKDVSRLRQAERELYESEQRFKSLFDHNPDFVYSFDTEGRLTSMNKPPALSMSSDEAMGNVFAAFLAPTELPKAIENFAATLQGEVRRYEVVSANGLEYDITNIPIYVNGGVTGVFGIAKDISELKRAQRELSESEQRYKSLFEHNPDGIFMLDREGRFYQFNEALPRILDIDAQELEGRPFAPFIHPDDMTETIAHFQAALRGEVRQYEVRALRKRAGDYGTFTVKNLPIVVNGEITAVYGIAKDITDFVLTRQELVESEERSRRLIELTPDLIFVQREGRLLFWNRAAAEALRAEDDERLAGVAAGELIAREDAERAEAFMRRIEARGASKEPEEIVMRRLDGSTFYAEIVGTTMEYNGESALLVIARDISKRKKTEQLVEYMAYHDALTGLPNRLRFHQMVHDQLSKPPGAMFFIDLDRFKLINDTLGHRTGDHLLNEVSRRLKSVEGGFVSRQGGDEFTAYFPGADRSKAERKAKELIDLLSEVYEVDGHELYVTPSVGISLYPQDSADVDVLIQQADTALYDAKEAGGNAFRFFCSETDQSNTFKMSLSGDLRKAISHNQLFLVYQPKYDLGNRRIVGAEALLRWKHPEKGIVPPDQFIPFAEETGLILPIGEWVLRTACAQAKAWRDEGYPLCMCVNLSVRQFLQHNFVEQLTEILEETGLEASSLNLEITETIPLLDLQAAIGKLHQIKDLGVTISLDDFGTGYSSLNYIRLLPFDFLKIDKSFIQNMHHDPFNTSIVQSVISIAHLMGKKVVAEGVETGEHYDMLKDSACDEAQGYFLSRPIEADRFEALIKSPKERSE